MGSTVKRFQTSSGGGKGQKVIEGMDEEFAVYRAVLERPVEKHRSLLNASLGDVPLDTRRKEARKPLYIARYE